MISNECCVTIRVNISGLENSLPGLSIPRAYRLGIARIGELSDEGFQELLASMIGNPEAETPQTLAAKISEEVPSVPKEHVSEILAALSSMTEVQKSAHVTAEGFSNDIWDALVEDSPEFIEGVDEDVYKSRIKQVLKDTNIQLRSVKAKELRLEVERSLYGARVLTDLRTVFGDDVSTRPAMTVMHTLELKYHHETGDHREFYISLDDEDLQRLKEVIERAQRKGATLVELMNKANFRLY